MSMFSSNSSTKQIDVQEWNESSVNMNYPAGSTLEVDMKPEGQDSSVVKKKVALFFDYGQLNLNEEFNYYDPKKYLESLVTDLTSLFNKHYISSNVWTDNEPSTYATDRIGLPMQPLTPSERNTLKYLEHLVSTPSFSDKLNYINLGRHVSLVAKTKMYLETMSFLKKHNINLSGDMGVFNEDELRVPYIFPEKIEQADKNASQWAFDASKPLSIYKSKPFISNDVVIAVWTSIMAVLLATTIFVYSRRDFK